MPGAFDDVALRRRPVVGAIALRLVSRRPADTAAARR
jgi:hypothetical protein